MVLDGGSNIRLSGGATLAVPGTFADKYPGTANVAPTALTVLGTGTVDLQTYQAYTGTTSVASGATLLLDAANPPVGVVSAGTINVLSAGTVRVAAANALLGNAGFGSYTGAAVKVSSGGTLATAAGVSTTAGNVTLVGGTLAAAAPAGPDGSFDFVNGSTLTVTSTSLANANSTASAAGIVLLAGTQLNVTTATTLTVTGSFGNANTSNLAGTLTKAGPGTLVLAAANPYAGPTNVSAGTVTVTATGSLTGTSALAVASGATFAAAGPVTSGPATTVNGTATFAGLTTLGTLSIGSAGHAALATAAAPAARNTLVTTGLSVAAGGQFDLANDDAVVRNTAAAAVAALLGTGGLTSSAAAANVAGNTAVGVIQAVGTTFDAVPVSPADVLVKYTYYGDANLDGVVNGLDYARIDAGYNSNGTLTGWYNGDFNYDGRVDGSDYTLIDDAFNTQAGTFSPNGLVAAATAEVAAAVPEPSCVLPIAAVTLLARRRRTPR